MRWQYLILITILFFWGTISAQTSNDPNELKNKINEKEEKIKQLEEEIKKYSSEAINANNEAKTLEGTIKSLDLTKKKITTDINLTENKITKTNLTIQEINRDITTTAEKININKRAIANAIKSVNLMEDGNFIALVLSGRTISDVLNEVDEANQIRDAVIEKTQELSGLKKDMENKQEDLTDHKDSLIDLKKDLSGQKQAVESTTREKSTILKETKNKEKTYKELVKTKEQQKAQFERELFEYESQLRYLIDPNSYPKPKSSILDWPLDSVYITQKFGKTVGAQKLYASGSHNGVDFRAPIGTKVKNMLTGSVVGLGDTDIFPGCYSFGKWVMVKHDNGLSSIYGHLSAISVQNGQRLNTGDTIGYSGNTGYSTGPHLHISVYATQGVRIEKYVNSRGCKEAVLPLADIRAYLDPLDYLPKI